VKAVERRAPDLNAVAERWVQGVKQECLDHFGLFGEAHLRHLLNGYLAWYHTCRPHQGLGNRPPCGADPPAAGRALSPDEVACEERPVVSGETLKRSLFVCWAGPGLWLMILSDKVKILLQQQAPTLVAGVCLPGGIETENPLTSWPLFVGNSSYYVIALGFCLTGEARWLSRR
jgi:hypothetical protein